MPSPPPPHAHSCVPPRQQRDGRALHDGRVPDRPQRVATHRRPGRQGGAPLAGGEGGPGAHSLPPVLPPGGPAVTRQHHQLLLL